jgi:pimeloyl-ACP methyl ester carboxylesterase
MPYIRVRGVDHYYEWIRNPDSTQAKPLMVFIHGWGGSSRYWESTARAIANCFDCLLYDMRGFGRSTKVNDATTQSKSKLSEMENVAQAESKLIQDSNLTAAELSYELESYAEDLLALLDALNLSKVYINAHSMGASVATFFLNRYPERVEQAILTCSGIFEYDEKAFSAFHKFGGYVVKFRPLWLQKIPLADKFFMARFLHRPLQRNISRAFLEDFLIADYDAALGTIFTSVSKKAAEVMPQEFAQVKVPTLLVAGQYDQIIPAQMGRQAAALSENLEFALIPNTAHFPMLEDPVTYLKRVQEFLRVDCQLVA